ncbi:esterase-like activity of phytase family protein [Rhizobium oryzicola]|uniref:Esterase-like activity of phytase family protein n=1 Tax=Rhizobium oryzicola TaxID=1232668 RepID=A0ABT8T050_9HYPH|nr:esterase-like activity of phytase family protein [Rhizobium oryzicola]
MRHTILRSLVLLAPLLGAAQSFAAEPDTVSAPVVARRIETFKPGSDETRFGKLEFLGGLELTSRESLFGSMSSIRFRADGRSFVSVLDTGHWLTGRIERDDKGRLSGLGAVAITPMRDASGDEPRYKGDIDAEGVTIRPGQVLVSFERKHRVDVYPDPGFEQAKPLRTLDILIPKKELKGNGSLETVVMAPAAGPLAGAPVIVAERSVDKAGNLYAAILEGPRKGQFKVVRNDPWDVTDGAFLPSGDLLLLERRFSFIGGVGMRMRRIPVEAIKPGALVDGPVLIETDMSEQIDNMEGIDVVAGADGHPHVILVSDDNHSILQRSLMLEFRLTE